MYLNSIEVKFTYLGAAFSRNHFIELIIPYRSFHFILLGNFGFILIVPTTNNFFFFFFLNIWKVKRPKET
jgi:hypothetical protein